MVGGGDTFYLKFGTSRPHWSEIADFEPIFTCSASAVAPSEKSSINTNRKSTTYFPVSPRWTSYVVPEPQELQSWQAEGTKILNGNRLKDKIIIIIPVDVSWRQKCD